ncbi:MAG: acetyl-CoA carboxylase carboxyltransferase subunit alpha [Agathobacter sp.]|nr:acetyl-CoA carboxylase carboxyltransferase subunit alpha [Agathobacter sp.]
MEDNKVLTPYDRVQIARKKNRPTVTDYIEALFDDFMELKGDRLGAEDESILGGIAVFRGMPVTVIGHRKGRTTEENIKYNFGMTSPEGYRKAVRLMKQAEKFKRPVITFVDTPGAYPGLEAETNGQSVAIAESIAKTVTLKVPVITIITGEGSSGGALAISAADSVWMLENAVYSILSPEGFAAIVWKDAKRAAEACDIMKITAGELLEYGLIDGIIPEGKQTLPAIRKMLSLELARLGRLSEQSLVAERYRKYRHIEGEYAPSV